MKLKENSLEKRKENVHNRATKKKMSYFILLCLVASLGFAGCIRGGPQFSIQRDNGKVGREGEPISQEIGQSRSTGPGAIYSQSQNFRNFGGVESASGVQSKSELFFTEGSQVSVGQRRVEATQ